MNSFSIIYKLGLLIKYLANQEHTFILLILLKHIPSESTSIISLNAGGLIFIPTIILHLRGDFIKKELPLYSHTHQLFSRLYSQITRSIDYKLGLCLRILTST